MKKFPKGYLPILALLLLAWLFLGRPTESVLPSAPETTILHVTDAVSTPVPTAEPTASLKPAVTQKPSSTPKLSETSNPATTQTSPEETLDEHGSYTTAEDVALYLVTYGHLPENFITKRAAEEAGWDGGSLEPYCPGKCIGGGRFGNYEGLLPSAKGRTWTECDINTLGARSRGPERLVFSNDGLIYYTGDHYKSFTLLYGDP